MIDEKPNTGSKNISCASMPESLILNHECRTYTTSSPSFSLRDTGVSETRARVEITPTRERRDAAGREKRALAFRSLYYPRGKMRKCS